MKHWQIPKENHENKNKNKLVEWANQLMCHSWKNIWSPPYQIHIHILSTSSTLQKINMLKMCHLWDTAQKNFCWRCVVANKICWRFGTWYAAKRNIWNIVQNEYLLKTRQNICWRFATWDSAKGNIWNIFQKEYLLKRVEKYVEDLPPGMLPKGIFGIFSKKNIC